MPNDLMTNIVKLVEMNRCPLNDEKTTQERLGEVFKAAGLNVQREHRLSGADIPDFMIDGIIVEVKIKGQRTAMLRQLLRYAEHADVHGIVLATSKSILLPDAIQGKPLRFASLSRAWL